MDAEPGEEQMNYLLPNLRIFFNLN